MSGSPLRDCLGESVPFEIAMLARMRSGESTQDNERSLFLVAVIVRDGVSGRPRSRSGSARDRYRPIHCSGRTRNGVHRRAGGGNPGHLQLVPTRLGPVRRLPPTWSQRIERHRLLMRENLTWLTMPAGSGAVTVQAKAGKLRRTTSRSGSRISPSRGERSSYQRLRTSPPSSSRSSSASSC